MLLELEIMWPYFWAGFSTILLKTGIFKLNKIRIRTIAVLVNTQINYLSINHICGQRQPSHQPAILGETQGG
jgi:hypothetical protein